MSKLTGLILIASMVLANAQDFMMVWAKKVDLYNDQGRIVKVLPYGTIVQTKKFAKDETRYLIQFDGQEYNAKKAFFKKPIEVVAVYKKKILDFEAKINKNNLRISNIDSDLIIRYVQILELRRDTALAYQRLTPYLTKGGGAYLRGYTSMLSEGKYKKLKKEWGADVEELYKEKAALQEEVRDCVLEISSIKDKIASFENLGGMIKPQEGPGSDYIVIQDNAQLYIENKVVKHLKKGEVVLGRPHPKFNGWYEVISDKVKYVVSGKAIVKKSDYAKVLTNKLEVSKILITQLNSEIETQQFRLKLYQGVSRQLEADKFVQGGYGLAKNLIIPIDKDRNFTIKSPNADQVYINSVKADKVLREWKLEATELGQASLANQKSVLTLKKQLIDLENDIKAFNN